VAALLLLLNGCAVWHRVSARGDSLTNDERLQLAQSYEQQKMFADARRELAIVLRRDPKNIPALLASGNVSLALGDDAAAEKAFRRTLDLDAANAGAQNNLAMVYLAEGKLPEAERLARSAAQSGPLRPYALETLAEIHVKEGKPAQPDWDAALDAVPPDNPDLRAAIERSRERVEAHTAK